MCPTEKARVQSIMTLAMFILHRRLLPGPCNVGSTVFLPGLPVGKVKQKMVVFVSQSLSPVCRLCFAFNLLLTTSAYSVLNV